MPQFTPPTVSHPAGTGPLLGRYKAIPIGQSVVKRDGHYEVTPFPWAGELEGLTEGVDFFLGGRTYTITDAVSDDLVADGFSVVIDTDGYNEGNFSDGEYDR